jgi:Mg2+ and Co2+ transporter CorA
MLEWIERKFKSAYLSKIEDENKQLREELAHARSELRQLMNAILAQHGMGQIEGPRSNQPARPLRRVSIMDYLRRKEREASLPRVAEPPTGKPDA